MHFAGVRSLYCGGVGMTSIEDALAECLEAIESGKADILTAVQKYPEYREELIALLEMAERVRSLRATVKLPQTAAQKLEERILTAGA